MRDEGTFVYLAFGTSFSDGDWRLRDGEPKRRRRPPPNGLGMGERKESCGFMVLRAGRLGLLAMCLHIGTMTWHATQAKMVVFSKFVRNFGRVLLECVTAERVAKN